MHEDDFKKLKEAYGKLDLITQNEFSYKNSYLLVFFQHFFSLVLKDENLKKDILDHLPNCIIGSFKNDIIKSTNDSLDTYLEIGIEKFKPIINKYVEGVNESLHINFDGLYSTINNKLRTFENRLHFLNQIEDNSINKNFKIKLINTILENGKSEIANPEKLKLQNQILKLKSII